MSLDQINKLLSAIATVIAITLGYYALSDRWAQPPSPAPPPVVAIPVDKPVVIPRVITGTLPEKRVRKSVPPPPRKTFWEDPFDWFKRNSKPVERDVYGNPKWSDSP